MIQLPTAMNSTDNGSLECITFIYWNLLIVLPMKLDYNVKKIIKIFEIIWTSEMNSTNQTQITDNNIYFVKTWRSC